MFTKQVYGSIIIFVHATNTCHHLSVKSRELLNFTGKLPIEVDMEAIPQNLLESELDIESQSTQDSPPPLPPKYY